MSSAVLRIMSQPIDNEILPVETTEDFSESEEKQTPVEHLERAPPAGDPNPSYDDEGEPEFHARTYVATAALFLLNFVQVFALTGPPAILDYIGEDLEGTVVQNWVPNALSLVQAVGGPILAFASDTFQARKILLIGTCSVSFIGAAIAPGSKDIYRVIVAQILIGFGFAAVPLAYAIPSEILPRRWRPMIQALMNVAAASGAISSPLIAGAFVRASAHQGWRNYYWVQMALWGITILAILVGYRPPKRHTHLDHLTLSQKLGRLDLPGMALLTGGLTLLLTGLSLGGSPWSWKNVRVVATLVIGFVLLIAFGLYEWKGTSTGVLHHELFASRTFGLCVALIFIEGTLLFTIIVFYPALTGALFETKPFQAALRTIPFWVCAGIATLVYGTWSSRMRTIRAPLMAGFAIMTAGIIGLATIQPGQSTRAIVFDGLAGIGFGSLLILIVVGVQLSTPHHLIATATANVTSSRAIAASTFTAIYAASLTSRTSVKLPAYISAAAITAGLPPSSVPAFVRDLLAKDQQALASVPGVTPAIIEASVNALHHALADSFRIVFIIGAPFGALACGLCFFIEDISSLMTYHVEAPVEDLKLRHKTQAIGV